MVRVLVRAEPETQRSLAELLGRAGHEVRLAPLARTAASPDLGTDDVWIAAANALAPGELGAHADAAPAVIVVGPPERATAALREGAFEYLRAPVDETALLPAVARAARQTRALRERDRARALLRDVTARLQEIGGGAATLAHEVRNPKSGITQALRAVAGALGTADTAILDDFRRRLDRIDAMFQRVVEFARPIELRRGPIEAAALLARAAARFGSPPHAPHAQHALHAQHAHLVLEVEAPAALPPIDGDAALLEDVLAELVGNAARACGGRGRVVLSARAAGGAVRIQVEDDGPGVAPALRSGLFGLFGGTQAPRTPSGARGASGAGDGSRGGAGDGGKGGAGAGAGGTGLAWCRKVVEAHGGTIELIEGGGPGACFRIEVPAAAGWTSSVARTRR